MSRPFSRVSLIELWRFYQAAAINTVFGYGLYAIFVTLGLNLFAAQALSFVCGATFNYLTYSRHVFRNAAPAKARFAGAYAVNYVVNVALLALFDHVVANHYASGALATIGASLVNYLVLKRVVFMRNA